MTPETKECGSCHAPIYWAAIVKKDGTPGKMPFDAKPSAKGTHRLFMRDEGGRKVAHAEWVDKVKRKQFTDGGGLLRTSHFATCPNAQQHRRSR